MIAPAFQHAARFFVDRFLNTAAEGVVLTGLVWGALRLIRRQNSGTRFASWFCALLAIVALPLFADSGLVGLHLHAFSTPNLSGRFVVSSSIASWLFVAWAVGAGFFLLRLGLGLWHVRQCRRVCTKLDLTSLDSEIAAIARDFDSHRRVELCVSSTATVPAAVGFFQPAIIIPAWLLPQLSAEEMKLILLHEIAHLRRWDDWTNLIQKFVRAIFFFHPAVWWIERRLTLEREMACDDMVLAETASPRAYAASLISFAEKLQDSRALVLAQALVGRLRQMSPRLAQILDENRPRHDGLRRPLLVWSAAMFVLVLVVTPCIPRIVTFQDRQLQAAQQGHATRPTSDAVELPLGARVIPAVAEHDFSSPLAARAKAVPAALHPRALQPRPVAIRQHAKTAAQPLVVMHPFAMPAFVLPPFVLQSNVPEPGAPLQGTVVILRSARYQISESDQTSQPAGWTLCIWHVEEQNANGWVESTIVVSSI